MNKKKGFTLVELLAVISIIAIIILMIYTNIKNSITNSELKSFVTDVKTIYNASLSQFAYDQTKNNSEIIYCHVKGQEDLSNPISFIDSEINYVVRIRDNEILEFKVNNGYYSYNNLEKNVKDITKDKVEVNVVNLTTCSDYLIDTTYLVEYDLNGGVGTIESQTKTFNVNLNLSNIIPSKDGHEFLGWSVNKNSKTAEYQSGSVYVNNKSVTLYAVWKKIEYIVKVTVDGGEVTPKSKNVTLASNNAAFNITVNNGYSLDDANVTCNNGQSATLNGSVLNVNNITSNTECNILLTANNYTISYNTNGGSVAPISQVKSHNEHIYISEVVPTKTGNVFLGWSTSQSSSKVEYLPGARFELNANTTLYAVWEE